MVKKTALRTGLIIAALTLWGTDGALANGNGPPSNDERGRRGPPPEAIEACEGLEEGDDCSFTVHDHNIDGTCEAGPKEDMPLACRPSRPPSSRRPPNREE